MQNKPGSVFKMRLFALCTSALLFAGCEKEPAVLFEEEVATAVNSAALDMQAMHHLWSYAHAIGTEYENSSLFCWSSVSDSVNGNTVILTYNFDNYQLYGCGYYDTAYTGGLMKITYTAPLATADSMVLELINFHASGNTYNGFVHISRTNPQQPVVHTSGIAVTRGAISYTLQGTVNVAVLSGNHSVTGNCTASGGQEYSLDVQTPLLITAPQTLFSFFKSGVATFKHPKLEATFNYGNGVEDNLATCATPDGLRYVLTLQHF